MELKLGDLVHSFNRSSKISNALYCKFKCTLLASQTNDKLPLAFQNARETGRRVCIHERKTKKIQWSYDKITRIIHKHSHVLYSSDRCKKVFTSLPLVAHRRCKNISDILVRAKLPEPVNIDNSRFPPGSFRCNKNNCTTCPYIEDGRTQYTFNSTGQMNQIKSHITCETSNVIYMIQCTKCNLQCIGETKRRLKERFNEHRRPIINTSSYNPTAVSRHFITGNHT